MSVEDDAFTAGVTAATAAVTDLGGETPSLVIVYAAARYDLSRLLRGIREATGSAPLVGGSSRGQFHDGWLPPVGSSVSVLALTAGVYQFGLASVTDLSRDPFAAGLRLARTARGAAGQTRAPYGALVLLTSGLGNSDPQQLLSGVYRVTGAAVPLVGGVTSNNNQSADTSNNNQSADTYVFHDGDVLTDAAVGIWIGSPRPLTVSCGHGWRAEGLPMMVTHSDGRIVGEIAGRPAGEIFEERCRDTDPAPVDSSGAGRPKIASYVLGLVEPDGNQVLRGAFLGPDGVLRSWAPLPSYAAVRVVSYAADELLEASEQVVSQTLTTDGARVLLAFSCAIRMEILDDRRHEEAKRMQAAAGDIPTFGFYTYGEFARTTSVAGYHNVAVTALAL